VTFGLATTFFLLSLLGAIVMRIADSHTFPSMGLAFWWALQTVTTVGYGDVVPTTSFGKFVGCIEMMIGVSLVSLLTAAVTSTIVHRGQASSDEEERVRQQQTAEAITSALGQLDERLGRMESELTKPTTPNA
jgi:voltage-gated potassium channel